MKIVSSLHFVCKTSAGSLVNGKRGLELERVAVHGKIINHLGNGKMAWIFQLGQIGIKMNQAMLVRLPYFDTYQAYNLLNLIRLNII